MYSVQGLEKTLDKTSNIKCAASAIVILLVICVAQAIVLGLVITKLRNKKKMEMSGRTPNPFCSDKTQLNTAEHKFAGLYDDLTVEEVIVVRDFLLKQPVLNLTSIDSATVRSNYIQLIEFQQPDKDAALDFLDRNGSKPQRSARVVIIMGEKRKASVEEYIVTPTDEPKTFIKRQIQDGSMTIPFNSRPGSVPEWNFVDALVNNVTQKLYRVLYESFDGYTYNNCSTHCLTYSVDIRQMQNDHRQFYVWFLRDAPGFYIHLIGLELVFNTSGNDASLWSLEKLFYYNQTFDSIDTFSQAYDNGEIYKMHLKAPDAKKPLFSSYERRGEAQPQKPLQPPEIFEPDGKRYTVSGHHIE